MDAGLIDAGLINVGLIIVAFAVFFASALSTAFGFGGIFLLSGILTFVMPISAVFPVQTVLMVGSQISRCVMLRSHIDWRFVRSFGLGSIIGAIPGALFYQQMSSDVITLVLAGILLYAAWGPAKGLGFSIPFGKVAIGAINTFLSTAFSFGGLIQATIFREHFCRTTITATIAISMLIMSMCKIPAYAMTGFDYSPYYNEILVGAIVAPFGTWVGKHLLYKMSERVFMVGFKLLLTVEAIRLIFPVIMPT